MEGEFRKNYGGASTPHSPLNFYACEKTRDHSQHPVVQAFIYHWITSSTVLF